MNTEERLAIAEELLHEIYNCPINWEQSTIPKSGFDRENPEHRKQVVGTQHISYSRIYKIGKFLNLM